jgi:hypothetical protein
MYPLDQGKWGPTVRIGHLRDELSRIATLDIVAGYRGPRRIALARYALSGRLRRLDGIYVESSSFLPSEADLAFLALARGLGVPVLTYVRDAYQRFPEYDAAGSLRRRLGRAAFRPMIHALRAVSTRLAFPTRGLAEAVLGRGAEASILLPPAAPSPVAVPRARSANRLLFVGDARLPAQGGDRLVAAVGRARELGAAVELTVVSRPGQEPPPPHPEWLRIQRAEGEAIHALLPDVIGSVIARPRSPYNDLALPVKLFDALAYGRPLLVTDCLEQARVVEQAGAGLVVADDPESIAAGIVRLAGATGEELDRWSAAAHRAAGEATWRDRAERIVELLVGGR